MEIADCYRVLGLRMGASYEDIKASYRRLARLYHPDSNLENQQQAKEKFIQVTDAYRCLVSVVQPSADPSRSPTVNLKQEGQQPITEPPLVKVAAPQSPPLQYDSAL
jgi:DnaJ domain